MDYENMKCALCNEPFKKGDDIVVCPECGAPHHRHCYEAENRCAFESKHKDGFVYRGVQNSENDSGTNNNQESGTNEDTVVCPRCKTENPKNMFYCGKCGYPLGMQNNANAQQGYNNTQQNNPYGQQPNGQPFTSPFDPMAGVNPDYMLDDNVSAGEASKFVQKSTQYFMRIFYNIKEFGKSRFNFAAFIFSGGYLLYRKMYKLGTILTALLAVFLFTSVYVEFSGILTDYTEIITALAEKSETASYDIYFNAFTQLDLTSQIILGISMLCSYAQIALQIVVGLKANRWYYHHTVKQISTLKANNEVNVQDAVESKGGVNLALAISLLVAYLLLRYLPAIFY